MHLTTAQLSQIERICRAHFVAELHIFGSALTNQFSAQSDLDLIVDFERAAESRLADHFFELKDDLEKATGRKIDLVMEDGLRNPVFIREINRTKKLIYETKNTHSKVAA